PRALARPAAAPAGAPGPGARPPAPRPWGRGRGGPPARGAHAPPAPRARRSGLLQGVAARQDVDLVAAILGPGLLVVAGIDGPLFAVRHRLDATRVDAVTQEVLLGRRGAPIAQGQVVLVGAALVAVSADADTQSRVRLQDRHLLVEHRGIAAPDDRLVVVEVDHRPQNRLHRVRGAADPGERVRRLLPALGVFPRPAVCLILCRLHGIVVRLLSSGERVRIGAG